MPPPSANTASDFIPPVGGLLHEHSEAQMFWQLRARTTAATVKWMLSAAWLRRILVASLSLFFWAGLYVLFYFGFSFLLLPRFTPTSSSRSITPSSWRSW